MTAGTSALQRENVRQDSSVTATVVRADLQARATDFGAALRPKKPPLTWIGPMEVMMEGCRYRLVPADPPASRSDEASLIEPLSVRETQIARLVAGGLVNKEIASELGISEWTVATHMRRIFAKLGVETRAAMVLRCFGGAR